MRAWNADDLGLTPDDWREIWWGEVCHERLMRWRALKALWLPPVKCRPRDRRKGWTIYDGYERNRDEEWTFCRGVRASIGLVLGLRPRLDPKTGNYRTWSSSVSVAYWDSGPTYGGYSVEVLNLHPWCRVDLFNDGETCL